MPNPFLRRPASTSKTDVDRPLAIDPVPETVHGPVFPYRGMETHGVDPTGPNRQTEDYSYLERGIEVSYEAPEEEPSPIPVRIVNEGGRELKRFRVTRMTAPPNTDPARSIIGRDLARTKLTVKNAGADTVYIGHDQMTASAMHGWPLAANETFTVEGSADPVWAQSSTANAVMLAMLIEESVTVNE